MLNNLKSVITSSLIASALLLSGCVTNGAGNSNQSIDYLSVDLPQQIKWVQSKNETMKNGGMKQEWIVNGFRSIDTPARISYQKLVPGGASDRILNKLLNDYKQSCKDIRITEIPLKSAHKNKASYEVICSQLGNNPFGVIVYVNVFSDNASNHLIRAEARTPPSVKAGQLDVSNQQQRAQAENIAALAQLMQAMSQNIKVCDANNNCQ